MCVTCVCIMSKQINKMNMDELRQELQDLGLSTSGNKTALKTRLEEARSKESLACDDDLEILEKEIALKEAKLEILRKIKKLDAQINGNDTEHEADPKVAAKASPPPSEALPVDAVGALARSLALSRLPVAEPAVFTGNPLDYGRWASALDRMFFGMPVSDTDKLYMLEKYVAGKAREAVASLFMLSSDSSYKKAREILKTRFGHSFAITEAFRQKLEAWPRVKSRDGVALRAYADYLNQCAAAQTVHEALAILDDPHQMQQLALKLPDWAVTSWGHIVVKHRRIEKPLLFTDS